MLETLPTRVWPLNQRKSEKRKHRSWVRPLR